MAYLFGTVLFLTYGEVNQYTARLCNVNSLVFDWEHAIPFWPWTIVPYWSIDLLYGISLFICTSKRELTIHVMRLIAASLVACAGFLLCPLKFSFTRPISENLFGWLFQQLEQFDLPYNQAPSLHIILLWLLWLRFVTHTSSRWRWLLHIWFALIGISVLTTWQHHAIDVISGLAVGVVISYLLPIHFRWHWQLSHEQSRLALARRYAIGALGCCFGAWVIGSFAWLLLWPGLCLFMIALGYIGLGVTVFQKNQQGKMSLSARILLAPYQLGSRLSFLYFRRKADMITRVVPGIYLGSFPYNNKITQEAVLDMTCDWPRSRFTAESIYIACPRLDLVSPTIEELVESVKALNELSKQGDVLVHCALGLSRSAIVIVAWLLQHHYASTVEPAINMVQSVRPAIVIHEGHLKRLSQWQKHYL